MKRNDVKVIKNIYSECGEPSYYVVLAKEIETYAADGTSFDYSLEVEDSTCYNDLANDIEDYFGIDSSYLSMCGENNDFESTDTNEIPDELVIKINEFKNDWLSEHEWHDEPLYWNYFDGSRWISKLLYSKDDYANNNKELELLDENDEEAIKVIEAYNSAEDEKLEWSEGYATYGDETTGLVVRFSKWSEHPSMADIFDME